MSSYAEHITTAHIQCDAEEALLPLLKELTDKQMLGGWRLRKHEIPPAGAVSLWYLLKDNAQIALQMRPKSQRIMTGLNISVMLSTPLTVFYIAICRLRH